jgi:predicted MPP superfamily phosphohydrolase
MGDEQSRRLTRRRLVRAGGGLALAGLAAAAIDAFGLEPYWLKRTDCEIGVDDLPAGWDGATVAHLTDIHVGRIITLGYVRKAVDLANAARPDVVVLTGDFVTPARAIGEAYADELRRLEAPLGVFAVLGNHDHWTDPAGVVAMLESAGVEMVTNRRVVLERGGGKLCLAGVDDLWEGRQLLDEALGGLDESVPRLVLCHNPDYAEVMPASPRVDLLLCGHTHGGQVRLPLIGAPRLPIVHAKYADGLVAGPACAVFVSRGVGLAGLPVRFNCRPEVPVLTLRRA